MALNGKFTDSFAELGLWFLFALFLLDEGFFFFFVGIKPHTNGFVVFAACEVHVGINDDSAAEKPNLPADAAGTRTCRRDQTCR